MLIRNIIFVASLRMSLLRKHAVSEVSRLALGRASASPAALWSRQFSGAEPLVIHANRPRSTYEEAFAQSLKNPEDFWGKAAYAVTWNKKWDQVLDASDPVFPKWCAAALHRHPFT